MSPTVSEDEGDKDKDSDADDKADPPDVVDELAGPRSTPKQCFGHKIIQGHYLDMRFSCPVHLRAQQSQNKFQASLTFFGSFFYIQHQIWTCGEGGQELCSSYSI